AELGVRVALLNGSVKGELQGAQILVGTHALIQEGVDLSNLAVAVVDEQHRFGVEQRGALAADRSPHVLHMTATPIPRTLALTVYGDLSVTEIEKPPASRKPIVTSWVTEEKSSEAYRRLRKHLDDGRQAYVVCPLIEESESSQARAEEVTDNARERLQALVDTTDGFELAEKDLELRGEGQLLGTRQAGLSEFRFTKMRADRELLERARELAPELIDHTGPLNDEIERFFAAAGGDRLA